MQLPTAWGPSGRFSMLMGASLEDAQLFALHTFKVFPGRTSLLDLVELVG